MLCWQRPAATKTSLAAVAMTCSSACSLRCSLERCNTASCFTTAAAAVVRKRRLQTAVKQGEKLLSDKERSPDPLAQAPELERRLKATMTKHHAGA
jgi:hypothetical protein